MKLMDYLKNFSVQAVENMDGLMGGKELLIADC
jgi:hypothetical protein